MGARLQTAHARRLSPSLREGAWQHRGGPCLSRRPDRRGLTLPCRSAPQGPAASRGTRPGAGRRARRGTRGARTRAAVPGGRGLEPRVASPDPPAAQPFTLFRAVPAPPPRDSRGGRWVAVPCPSALLPSSDSSAPQVRAHPRWAPASDTRGSRAGVLGARGSGSTLGSRRCRPLFLPAGPSPRGVRAAEGPAPGRPEHPAEPILGAPALPVVAPAAVGQGPVAADSLHRSFAAQRLPPPAAATAALGSALACYGPGGGAGGGPYHLPPLHRGG